MNSKSFRLAFFSTQKYDITAFECQFPEHISAEYFSQPLNESSVKLAEGFDGICCFVNDVLDETVIKSLSQLGVKLIALRCAGFNNVDLNAAKMHNIKVVRVPAYSPEAVAEHCLALILTLSRKTHKAYNRVKENNFDLNGLLGFNLHNKTVGVIGLGKIGSAFVKILNGFGANVIYFDPFAESELAKPVSLETLYQQSDIIALHCPLTNDTLHIINEEALEQMKPGVMLVNTSRGALIDTKACISALKSRKLGYLALDVYEQESELFFKDMSCEIIDDDVFQRLLTFPNVLITGHQGFFTKEAVSEIVATTLHNVNEFITNSPLTNEVK
ncbi:2-hydroxyacid dehydrogenase [Pseudoalteromonas sp. G4]|uniref:2-hydroxyacid dehydrogenase n=1 Tax=Pseudoalteromonas sp. G4 TaxID=2992761 RepID=UPI00237E542B|nr:2-hydroxyacid dehydrogenase [Pseudoalteromonas sp. G4]MDE3272331.1 2-hydroxyacid dehydrogenase [Pseudoalteromonas sp. G4]